MHSSGSSLQVRHPAVRTARSFTLVELLIVVVILGILAALVIPQFSDATGDTKLSSLKGQLDAVRKQIEVYRLQHNGALPSFAQFEAQMTGMTNPDGSMGGSPTLGPFLNKIPINPFTDDDDLGTGSCGSSSWFYDENTGEFRANCHGPHCPL